MQEEVVYAGDARSPLHTAIHELERYVIANEGDGSLSETGASKKNRMERAFKCT